MIIRQAWVVLVVILCPTWSTASDPSPEEYARVEVRGKLIDWRFADNMKDRYAVTIGGERSGVVYHLVLPDAMRESVRKLVGEAVVVTGDLSIKTLSDGKRLETRKVVGQLQVKSLTKADMPKK